MNKLSPGTLFTWHNNVYIILKKDLFRRVSLTSPIMTYEPSPNDIEVGYVDVAKRYGHLKILDSMPEFWFIAPEGAE